MSTEVLTQALSAGVTAKFGAGTMFLVIAAPSASLNIVARQIGNSNKNRTFTGAPAGFKFTADGPQDGFDTLEVTSSTNQTIQIAVGNDDVSYSNSVTVANTVTTEEIPSGSITVSNSTSQATGTALSIAANASRRRITIGSLSANTGSVFVQSTGAGVGKGIELQPGMFVTVSTTAAIDVRNDTGASQTITQFEET